MTGLPQELAPLASRLPVSLEALWARDADAAASVPSGEPSRTPTPLAGGQQPPSADRSVSSPTEGRPMEFKKPASRSVRFFLTSCVYANYLAHIMETRSGSPRTMSYLLAANADLFESLSHSF